MKIFLVRHGKSDKSLQNTLPHDEFELNRALVEGEAEKASELGSVLRKQLESLPGYDFVWSGKERSKQTVLAIAEGLGSTSEEVSEGLREDFGLTYLADKSYWHSCENAVKTGGYGSHADFFLVTAPEEFFQKNNIPYPGFTFSAEYMQSNMKSVLRRAIERNTFRNNEVSVMVSHEPVISLCMSDLTGKTVKELGGSCSELEYAIFNVKDQSVQLLYREQQFDVSSKIFS